MPCSGAPEVYTGRGMVFWRLQQQTTEVKIKKTYEHCRARALELLVLLYKYGGKNFEPVSKNGRKMVPKNTCIPV